MKSLLLFFFFICYGPLICQEILDSSIVHFEQLIYFKSNEHSLNDNDREDLNQLISKKDSFETYKFYVDAHTDDVGSEEYNQKLSERRKESIVSFLKAIKLVIVL